MSLHWSNLLWVGVGGGAGAMLRVVVTHLVPAGRLPWGTLVVNVLGSLAIGAILGRWGATPPESAAGSHAFLVAGFCGGFTTFSAFSWQLWEQVRQGEWALAVVHVVLSVAICCLATAVGWRLTR